MLTKFRFRKTTDIDIEAETEEEARKELSFQCARAYAQGYPMGDEDTFELLGTANLADLTPELLEAANRMNGYVLMSVQYRGENFACLCKVEDLDAKYVSVKPVALLLKEDQKEHIADVMGDSPESGLRKKLNLE